MRSPRDLLRRLVAAAPLPADLPPGPTVPPLEDYVDPVTGRTRPGLMTGTAKLLEMAREQCGGSEPAYLSNLARLHASMVADQTPAKTHSSANGRPGTEPQRNGTNGAAS